MDKAFEGNGGNKEGARKVGEMIAKQPLKRVSPKSYSTEAVTFITDAFRS